MYEHNIFDFDPDEDPNISLQEECISTLRKSLNHLRGDQEATARVKKEIREKRKYIRKLKKEKCIK